MFPAAASKGAPILLLPVNRPTGQAALKVGSTVMRHSASKDSGMYTRFLFCLHQAQRAADTSSDLFFFPQKALSS